MNVYGYVPHLIRIKKVKGMLSVNLTDIPPDIKRDVANHLRDEVLSFSDPKPVHPATYFLELFTLSVHGSEQMMERFLLYYSKLAMKKQEALKELRKHLDCRDVLDIGEYLERTSAIPSNPLRLYWLKVRNGKVYMGDFSCILPLLEDIVSYSAELKQKVTDPAIRDELKEILRITRTKRSGKMPKFYRNLLDATGIEDGKKRIIMYWLAPYLVNIKGMTKEEAVGVIMEWLSRQDGQRVPHYWVRAEVESVARKGIRPWRRDKVFEKDPQIKEILEKHGIV